MITKRQLGFIVIALGLLMLAATVGVDLIGAGQWGGFGPLQRIGIGLSLPAVAVGCVLIRLGDRPA
ncbi:MAG: hypothetical protein DRJ03_11400 [Chloroflexi bacterium]|nr:MAG: hypothetical protein DRI81_04855 [Chloroflexota bacterium]RLC85522.1 MAG: hypothetical protein DRJ03_11400 [Chloroflexota bacterium]HEY73057.1 hypothetical protein [Thermoflexia bacterium]